jgi:PhnB protein
VKKYEGVKQMAIQAYINFNGNCREAVEYYAEVFKTEKNEIMTFGDAPPEPDFTLPEEVKGLVMHTFLNICGSKVMFSDTFPSMPFVEGNNISLAIVLNSEDEIKELFHKLKVGGTVSMDIQETFWSKCYGMLTDKFGISWQFSHESGEQI